jgi:hypothetical protein
MIIIAIDKPASSLSPCSTRSRGSSRSNDFHCCSIIATIISSLVLLLPLRPCLELHFDDSDRFMKKLDVVCLQELQRLLLVTITVNAVSEPQVLKQNSTALFGVQISDYAELACRNHLSAAFVLS